MKCGKKVKNQQLQIINEQIKYSILFVPILFVMLSCAKCSKNRYDVPDEFEEKCRKIVTQEKNIGQEYFFKKYGQGVDEFFVTYMGNIITKSKDSLFIVNFASYKGLYDDAKRGNGILYIYDKDMRNLGYYELGASWALPAYIERNLIVFEYNNDFCNKKTLLNLSDSIPQKLFINCSDQGGDIYIFKSNDIK